MLKMTQRNTIEEWRAAKRAADKGTGYRDRLGCVGEPIADCFEAILRLYVDGEFRDAAIARMNAAAADARGNLRDYVNDARQQGADEILSDIECVVQFDSYDIELDTSDTLADVAQRGFDSAVSQITGQCWNVTEVTDEEL